MTTFTEEVVAAMRKRGWEIHHMEEWGFEWWWIPEKHTNYWTGNDGAGDSRDWYMTFRDAIGQALVEDEQAVRAAEPLIPRGSGKIICDEKHGEVEYESAMMVVASRVVDGYWYENWDDKRDNPELDPKLYWQSRAEKIVAQGNEDDALAFLIERRGFEYERFYFEHPEPSPVAS